VSTNKTAQLIFDGLLLIGLFLMAVAIGCQSQNGPRDNVANTFLRDYAIGLSSAFLKAGSEVEQGNIKTDADLLEALKGATESARKEAAIGIDTYLEEKLSNGDLTRDDAKVLRDLGQQFREAYRGR
jgi:hypothetical protein